MIACFGKLTGSLKFIFLHVGFFVPPSSKLLSFYFLWDAHTHTVSLPLRLFLTRTDTLAHRERGRESLQMISGLQSIQQVLALLMPLPVSTQKHSGVQSNAHSLCCFCGLIYRGDPRGLVHQHDWLIRKFGSWRTFCSSLSQQIRFGIWLRKRRKIPTIQSESISL